MMKKVFFSVLLLFFVNVAQADEGMWLPIDIGKLIYSDMEKMGLELTPEQIYSVNHSSLTDAIVSLGGFCTGEIISPSGLMLTNHHCAESAIQAHSSVENDYLSDGFWAQTMEDELPNEDLYARFLVRMEDVTGDILKDIADDMSQEEREKYIHDIITELVTQAEQNSFYDAEIKPVYEGNKYYLFIYKTYKDVRLVGAPPTSIGAFGGETDNWVYPRHTGDFALFRVYMSPEGEPADYSPQNIPLKPEYYLPISLKGYEKGDFSMTLGFPGTTKRYITSYGLELAVEQTNPDLIEIMQERQGILKKAMEEDPEVRIQYHSKFFTISNSLKYYIGQIKGVKDLEIIDQRRQIENKFQEWAKQSAYQEEYGQVIQNIATAYDSIRNYNRAFNYDRYTRYLIEVMSFAYSFNPLESILEEDSVHSEKLNQVVQQLKQNATEFYQDYNAATDQQVWASLMNLYANNINDELQPDFINTNQKKYGSLDQWAEQVYQNSIFTDQHKLMNFLDSPSQELLENDPAYKAANQLTNHYRYLYNALNESYSQLNQSRRKFIKGLMLMDPDKEFYPDANSSLHLSYGQIKGYNPRDAVTYRYYTTLAGVAQKNDPTSQEFDAPDKLLELYEDKDYGRYGVNDTMMLDFTSNNDITGGNSGSPVINGQGELIGIAFDGNWEAMSSDIRFEPQIQRMISVDIRYVLFIIDKFARADHLIREMTLVTSDQPAFSPSPQWQQEIYSGD